MRQAREIMPGSIISFLLQDLSSIELERLLTIQRSAHVTHSVPFSGQLAPEPCLSVRRDADLCTHRYLVRFPFVQDPPFL